MAKRFYDTGLPDQLWYQKLSPKCKALYLHLLCKCDVAGTFEINYPMMSAYVGDTITESDLFGSFGNRVVPLTGSEDKGILVDFVYFQCGGEINPNVKAHQSVLRRLDELGITVDQLRSMCTHELRVYGGEPKCRKILVAEPVVEPQNGTPLFTQVSVNALSCVKRDGTSARVKPVPSNKNKDVMALFDEFYAAYPRHDSKQAAILKFAKHMNDCKNDDERHELLDKMIASIEKSKKSDQWQKDGGKYIPMPATWLNQKRWEDEGLVSSQSESVEQRSIFAKALSGALKI